MSRRSWTHCSEFPGVEELREQAKALLARPGCGCGCGTIELLPQGEPPCSAATSPAPSVGRVRNADGDEVGGLLLFIRHGLLESLEIYSCDQPLPLPHPSPMSVLTCFRSHPAQRGRRGHLKSKENFRALRARHRQDAHRHCGASHRLFDGGPGRILDCAQLRSRPRGAHGRTVPRAATSAIRGVSRSHFHRQGARG